MFARSSMPRSPAQRRLGQNETGRHFQLFVVLAVGDEKVHVASASRAISWRSCMEPFDRPYDGWREPGRYRCQAAALGRQLGFDTNNNESRDEGRFITSLPRPIGGRDFWAAGSRPGRVGQFWKDGKSGLPDLDERGRRPCLTRGSSLHSTALQALSIDITSCTERRAQRTMAWHRFDRRRQTRPASVGPVSRLQCQKRAPPPAGSGPVQERQQEHGALQRPGTGQ